MRARGSTLVMVLATVVLAACGGSGATAVPAANGETYVSAVLGTGYEGALSVRNQLALGILGLQGSANEVTEEQAAALLPLWQGLRGTTRSGASAVAEVDALLSQIEETLTPAQLEAVAGMQLTQDRLGEWASTQGITLGTGSRQEAVWAQVGAYQTRSVPRARQRMGVLVPAPAALAV